MKYMLIIYGNQELWSSIDPAEFAKEIAAFDAFNKKYYDSGELLGAYGVADAAATKLVRLADGQPAVTDGPYLETKEYLASWYLLDVESEERALAIAAELPSAKSPSATAFKKPAVYSATSGGKPFETYRSMTSSRVVETNGTGLPRASPMTPAISRKLSALFALRS